MAHIIGRHMVYILRAQITTRLNPILNSDWLHALTHFSPNSGVCLLNRLRMTPSIMAPIDFGWKCIDFQKVVLERSTNQS
ncbi:hypothetical protein BLOT_015373 [Blomia tropicalis]|nr:hypothetical protein BLOT_015373 [Blomia tropicalis]